MRSGGGSFGHVSLHIGEDWWTHLATYDDHPPILDVDAGSTSVTFSIGPHLTDAVVAFARELADQAVRFAAEMERLYVRQRVTNGDTRNGEAA